MVLYKDARITGNYSGFCIIPLGSHEPLNEFRLWTLYFSVSNIPRVTGNFGMLQSYPVISAYHSSTRADRLSNSSDLITILVAGTVAQSMMPRLSLSTKLFGEVVPAL